MLGQERPHLRGVVRNDRRDGGDAERSAELPEEVEESGPLRQFRARELRERHHRERHEHEPEAEAAQDERHEEVIAAAVARHL